MTNPQSFDSNISEELNVKVLSAIQGALREEKEPRSTRVLKIAFWALLSSTALGIPFLLAFEEQLDWVWAVAWAIWALSLTAGFALHFLPQPRLVVRGVFSPFIFGRLLVVASLATIVQILVCPSLVFLDSPLGWNPLLPVTNALTRFGGMNACMVFCGFFFSFLSGLVGLASISKVLSRIKPKEAAVSVLLVIASQAPVLLVQTFSEELRPFLAAWGLGLAAGALASLGIIQLWHQTKGKLNAET